MSVLKGPSLNREVPEVGAKDAKRVRQVSAYRTGANVGHNRDAAWGAIAGSQIRIKERADKVPAGDGCAVKSVVSR